MEDETTSGHFSTVPPGTDVTVRAHKYDGREYRHWQVQFAALVPGGARLEATFSPVVEGRTPFFGGDHAVEFFYDDRGYNVIAGFAPDGTFRACYCNICTPATFVLAEAGPEIHFVDLDLDVLVWPDGTCVVTDEDDFAENGARYSYSPATVRAARAAVDVLIEAVHRRESPFDRLRLPAID